MKIFRPILSLIIVLTATLLVSCSSPTVSTSSTYTPEILQRITTYRIPVDIAQQRLAELGKFIDDEDWVNTETFIHGPLGLIRRDMTYLANALLPRDQEKALDLAKEIFDHFEDIDAAAKDKNYGAAIGEYKEVVSDFDLYLDLVPETKKAKTAKTKQAKAISPAKQAKKNKKNVLSEFAAEVEEAIDEIIVDTDT